MAKSEDILRKTQELLSAKSEAKKAEKMQVERERSQLVDSLSKNIADLIRPALEEMAQAQQVTVDSIRQMLKEIKVEVPRTEVQMPQINVPRPQVSVNVPEFKMPPLNIPAPVVNFPEKMSVSMDSVDNKSPLPVMMMGGDGKPMSFSMGAGGGGKADFLTIKDIRTSSGGSWFNDEGLRVSGSFSVTASNSSTQAIDSSGEVYSQANPFPVIDMSGALGSTASALIDSSGVQYSGSNPVPVTLVSGGTSTTAVQNLNADGTYRDTFPVSGSVTVASVTASTQTALIDSTGIQYSGSNPFPMRIVTDATSSVNVVNTNPEGLPYSEDNPISMQIVASGVVIGAVASGLDTNIKAYGGSAVAKGLNETNNGVFRVVQMTDAVSSVYVTGSSGTTTVVGSTLADVADDGSAPVQSGGIARTANPTAVAGGDVVKASYDDLGRQLTRPVQVRDLIVTAYTSLTNGTETTLLAASAGFYHDLIYIMGANASDVAVTVDIRPVTAGNTVLTMVIPASGTAGVSLPVPIPQMGVDTGNNWTADMGDITGTSVYLSALFTKEV